MKGSQIAEKCLKEIRVKRIFNTRNVSGLELSLEGTIPLSYSWMQATTQPPIPRPYVDSCVVPGKASWLTLMKISVLSCRDFPMSRGWTVFPIHLTVAAQHFVPCLNGDPVLSNVAKMVELFPPPPFFFPLFCPFPKMSYFSLAGPDCSCSAHIWDLIRLQRISCLLAGWEGEQRARTEFIAKGCRADRGLGIHRRL